MGNQVLAISSRSFRKEKKIVPGDSPDRKNEKKQKERQK